MTQVSRGGALLISTGAPLAIAIFSRLMSEARHDAEWDRVLRSGRQAWYAPDEWTNRERAELRASLEQIDRDRALLLDKQVEMLRSLGLIEAMVNPALALSFEGSSEGGARTPKMPLAGQFTQDETR